MQDVQAEVDTGTVIRVFTCASLWTPQCLVLTVSWVQDHRTGSWPLCRGGQVKDKETGALPDGPNPRERCDHSRSCAVAHLHLQAANER